jgi:two-component system, NtrC family, sensor histidine kinase KinB
VFEETKLFQSIKHWFTVPILGVVLFYFFMFGNNNITPLLLGIWVLTTLFLCGITILAGQLKQQQWTGYIFVSIMFAVITFPPFYALLMLVIGTTLAFFYKYYFGQHPSLRNLASEQLLKEFLGRLSISGAGLLVGMAFYHGFEVITHIQNLTDPRTIIAYSFTIVAVLITMYGMGSWLFSLSREQLKTYITDNLPRDAALHFVAVLLNLIFYDLGFVPFAILFVLVSFHAFRLQQSTEIKFLLNKRDKEIVALNTSGQIISNKHDLNEYLQQIHQQINKLMNVTSVFTVLYDSKRNVLEYPAISSSTMPQKPQRRKLANGLTDWVIRKQEPLLFNETHQEILSDKTIVSSQLEALAYIGVPLVVGNHLIGVIGVEHQENPSAFVEDDLQTLITISSQVSLAIRNAKLYSRNIKLAESLSLINQSLHQVMFNLDRNNLTQIACQIACKVSDTDKAALFTITERLDTKLLAQHGLDMLSIDDVYPYRVESFANGSRVIEDVFQTNDTELIEMAKRVGFKSCLEVPLRASHTIIGFIGVYHSDTSYYEETEINLLEMLASQVTAAFDNTDLLQALELYATEQAQLVHLSRNTAYSLDPDQVILEVCQLINQMATTTFTQIGLFSQRRDALQVFTPSHKKKLQESNLSLKELPEIEIVLNNPETANPYTLYVDDNSISPEANAFMTKNETQVLGLIPMLINNQVFGMVILHSKEHMIFSDNMRRLLEMALHQVSVQIHNARVHHITEVALAQQLEQLSLIEDIAQQISQSLTSETIISNVLDAALRATQGSLSELALLDTEHSQWQIISLTNDSKQVVTKVVEIKGIFKDVLTRKDIVSIYNAESIEQDKQWHSLAVPLLVTDNLIGVLHAKSNRTEAFTPEHVNFLKSLAGHAAMSIDNAKLLLSHQSQIRTLTELRQLTLEVVDGFDSGNVYFAILKTALNLLNGYEAALFGYQGDEIVPIEAVTCRENQYVKSEPTFMSEPIYQAARTMKLSFAQTDGHPEYDSQGNLIYPTFVAIPIVRHNQVNEVVTVGYKHSYELSNSEKSIIDLLAVQVASHIENTKLNQAIRTSNDRMRAILDSTRDGIILLDNAGRIKDFNLMANHLLHFYTEIQPGDLLMRLLEQTEINTPTINALESAMNNMGTPIDVNLFRVGKVTHLQLLVLPVNDMRGMQQAKLLSIKDTTEEQQVVETRERLQRMVLHDLRSPIGAIITGLSFLKSFSLDVPEEDISIFNKTIDVSLESGDNLIRLMDTLRDIPKMRTMEINPLPIALNDLVTKAYESLEVSFTEAQIQFSMDVRDDVVVAVDKDLIRRVFINLLHNALKFTPEKGQIKVVMKEIKTHEERFVQVMVCDSGPGIPLEMWNAIFEEFKQVENSLPKRGGKGTGLGLTFCQLAIETHQGKIWVSNEGILSGACFAFTLPLYQESLILTKE